LVVKENKHYKSKFIFWNNVFYIILPHTVKIYGSCKLYRVIHQSYSAPFVLQQRSSLFKIWFSKLLNILKDQTFRFLRFFVLFTIVLWVFIILLFNKQQFPLYLVNYLAANFSENVDVGIKIKIWTSYLWVIQLYVSLGNRSMIICLGKLEVMVISEF